MRLLPSERYAVDSRKRRSRVTTAQIDMNRQGFHTTFTHERGKATAASGRLVPCPACPGGAVGDSDGRGLVVVKRRRSGRIVRRRAVPAREANCVLFPTVRPPAPLGNRTPTALRCKTGRLPERPPGLSQTSAGVLTVRLSRPVCKRTPFAGPPSDRPRTRPRCARVRASYVWPGWHGRILTVDALTLTPTRPMFVTWS